MAIVSMTKLLVAFPKNNQAKFLTTLQKLGCTHLEEVPAIEQNPNKSAEKPSPEQTNYQTLEQDLSTKIAQINFGIQFLQQYKNREQTIPLSQKVNPELRTVNQQQLTKVEENAEKLLTLTQTLAETEKELNQIKADCKKLTATEAKYQPWQKLSALPEETEFTESILLQVPTNKQTVMGEIKTDFPQSKVHTIDSNSNYQTLTYLKKDKVNLNKWLQQHDLQTNLIDLDTLPQTKLRQIKEAHAALISKQQQIITTLKSTSKEIPNLETLYDIFNWKLEKLTANHKLWHSKLITLAELYLPTEKADQIIKTLETNHFLVKRQALDNPEKTPVILKNHNLIEPFEAVTRIYGLPKYTELDPTPYLAPFFILFYALALTDAGYGLLMIVTSLTAIRILKLPRQKQGLFRLLAYAGVTTTLIGALFGGWFGIDIKQLTPGSLTHNFITKLQIIDPIQETIKFMSITFVLGIMQIWFSQLVKAIHAHQYKLKSTKLEGLLWLIILPLIALTILIPGNQIINGLLIATLILQAFVRGRVVKQILFRPLIGSINILQDLIGFVSDMLSYSRLMALGLATGIIAFIINTIAGIFRDLVPGIGWLVWLLIIVGGHIFNLGINALGSFIHSGRLQFVEFFPKFMEGGGTKFNPFKREGKYVNPNATN